MKTKLKTVFNYACTGSILAVFLFACSKKDEPVINPQNQATALSLSMASSISQSLYDDVFNQINIEAENNNMAGRLNTETGTLGCATVTLSPADLTTFPKVMTIDYGAGCTVGNITRKGKLTVNLNGRLRTTGTVISVAFDDYSANGYKLEGTFSVTNNTTNNVLSFTTQTTNGKITYPAGLIYYTHSGTHTYTLIGGASTTSYLDDSWSVTGSGITTSSSNESLALTIKTPLVKSVACGAIISGIQEFNYNNLSGNLNFGSGSCDREALLTIGAFNTTINF